MIAGKGGAMKTQLIRTVAGLAVLLFFLPFTASPNNRANPFQMRVVDQTGHGVPHVKLTSDNGIVCYTRADGSVLWTESSLMDRDVKFRVESTRGADHDESARGGRRARRGGDSALNPGGRRSETGRHTATHHPQLDGTALNVA